VLPEDCNRTLTLRSVLDAERAKAGVERYRDLSGKHLRIEQAEVLGDETALVETETVQSRLRVAHAVRTRLLQGGTTAEGVHLAAMAGSIDVLQLCFAGVETRGDALHLNPYWPRELGRLEFTMSYREQALTVRLSLRDSTAPGLLAVPRRSAPGETGGGPASGGSSARRPRSERLRS
jgi:hypothetical protein